jgi:hypothetical protein
MAIAVESSFHGHGATLDNYLEALKLMGTTPEGPHPDPNCLFHWVTEEAGGLRVTDVWKTKEAFEKFAAEKVAPIGEQVGFPQPQIKFIEVANYCTAG